MFGSSLEDNIEKKISSSPSHQVAKILLGGAKDTISTKFWVSHLVITGWWAKFLYTSPTKNRWTGNLKQKQGGKGLATKGKSSSCKAFIFKLTVLLVGPPPAGAKVWSLVGWARIFCHPFVPWKRPSFFGVGRQDISNHLWIHISPPPFPMPQNRRRERQCYWVTNGKETKSTHAMPKMKTKGSRCACDPGQVPGAIIWHQPKQFHYLPCDFEDCGVLQLLI